MNIEVALLDYPVSEALLRHLIIAPLNLASFSRNRNALSDGAKAMGNQLFRRGFRVLVGPYQNIAKPRSHGVQKAARAPGCIFLQQARKRITWNMNRYVNHRNSIRSSSSSMSSPPLRTF